MLENKEQEKIAGIISDFFGGAVNEADIDILAMKIYEKYVAKLEQDLEFTTKTANELIEIKHKLEQEFAELKEKYNKASEKLKNITEEVENNFVHGQDYEKLKQELAELKEKAIVPKFKIGQNIFFIDNECRITQGVVDVILTGQDVFEKWCKYSIDLGLEYEDDIRFIDKNEEEIFATKEEAQDKLKEIKGMSKEKLKEYLQSISKDRVIELCLQFMFDAEISEQQLAEKDKEIAHLKEMDNYHLLYELAGADETIANLKKQLEEKDKDKTQLAIQELEKVKMITEWKFNSITDVVDFIDQQIKDLKGE